MGLRFSSRALLRSIEKLIRQKDEFDGFVIYFLGMWYLMDPDPLTPICETGKPVVVVDDYLASCSSRFPLMARKGFRQSGSHCRNLLIY